MGLILNEIFGRNSVISDVRREFEFDDVDAYLEVMIKPNLKGRCETPTTKLSQNSRPPLQNSPPNPKPDIPRGRPKNEFEADETETEEGIRYCKSNAKSRSSSMISMKKPSCRDNSVSSLNGSSFIGTPQRGVTRVTPVS